MAKFVIGLEARICDDDGNILTLAQRDYNTDTLDRFQDIVAHFGKSTALLAEGAEIGLDADSIRDEVAI